MMRSNEVIVHTAQTAHTVTTVTTTETSVPYCIRSFTGHQVIVDFCFLIITEIARSDLCDQIEIARLSFYQKLSILS